MCGDLLAALRLRRNYAQMQDHGWAQPKECGIIDTEEAGTLVFSGVPAFLVTIVLIVQCSSAYNVHRFERPLLTFQRL